MTRKRFIKLLMASGHSRDKANEIAALARDARITYETAYRATQKSVQAQIEAAVAAINATYEAAVKVCTSLVKTLHAFSETFRAEMERHEKSSRP